MMAMRSLATLQLMVAAAGALAALEGFGATPAEVQQALARGEKVTVLDIRGTAEFQKGHIPGAINVPGALIPEKTLPPLGRVVVCDEGLGRAGLDQAVAALNRKPGITAEALTGGLAGWETANGLTTRSPGLKPEELKFITYDQLQRSDFADLVLVDLRHPRPEARQDAAGAAAPSPPPLTDLSRAFPAALVTRSPFRLPQSRQADAQRTGQPPLLVLIDDDNQTAAEMARTLKANGLARVVILAGGEAILAREGKPGLGRSSATVELQTFKK
jgi:rhodanese-related sulfurtransferase